MPRARTKTAKLTPSFLLPIPNLTWVTPAELAEGDSAAVLVKMYWEATGIRLWLMEQMPPIVAMYSGTGTFMAGVVHVSDEGWRIGPYLLPPNLANIGHLVVRVG